LITCRENNGTEASLFTGIIHTALNLIENYKIFTVGKTSILAQYQIKG
jgi:hypothetical protein